MTAVTPRPDIAGMSPTRADPLRPPRPGVRFLDYLRTTDPKTIGVMYIVTSIFFFLVGGVLALLMRAELARPGLQFLTQEQYNQLFTMHGTIMLLLYATPIVFGFANFVLPLQIGAPGCRLPPAERVLLLAVPVRRDHRRVRILHPRRRRRLRLDRLRAPVQQHQFARRRRRPVDHGTRPGRARHHPRRGQHDHHRRLSAVPGYDHVADADLHLGDPGHRDPDADRVPRPHGRAARPGSGPALRHPRLRPRPMAAQSCGSTCSGSSGTPRSTSLPYHSSASSPRSSRSSPASRSSATADWSTPHSASPHCRSPSGPTTCSRPGRCCFRSSPSRRSSSRSRPD